jgi:uncharacterized metal-binding protein
MIIVPCCGVCNLGRLSVDAAKVALKKDGRMLLSLGSVAASHEPPDQRMDILAIDGCERKCVTVILQGQGLKQKWNLTISDLGISRRDDGSYDSEDIVLVADAIEAACVDVGDQVPKLNGTCAYCS